MKDVVAIGMSGGIDSSISALLLKDQGYEVVGFTLKLWDNGLKGCNEKEIAKAEQFAHSIGIEHHVIDLRLHFKKNVVDYFIQEYVIGRTPNPCVICNRYIKFGAVFDMEFPFSFDFLATGHYCCIEKREGQYLLKKAKDNKKSQEYFLARVNQDKLHKILFPLCDKTKDQVRKIAQEKGYTFRHNESQEICFIKPPETYHDFIMKQVEGDFSGHIVDQNNKVLNTHPSFFKYTIGQRSGLGIGSSAPYYVVGIDAEHKNVVVGRKEDVYHKSCEIEDVIWYKEIQNKNKIKVKIRYNHTAQSVEIIKSRNSEDSLQIQFKEHQLAITPGQLAVIYEGDYVIGSGWISKG